MSALAWNGLTRLAGVALFGAALAAASWGCGSNKPCDDLCAVTADRIRECCETLGTSWCIAGHANQPDWIAACSADYAVAISDARVEDRNAIRNQCAQDILTAPTLACSDLIEHYDDTWEDVNGDDDTVTDDDTTL